MPVCRNWQTRQTQNLLSARVCGFESHHRHQVAPGGNSRVKLKVNCFLLSSRFQLSGPYWLFVPGSTWRQFACEVKSKLFSFMLAFSAFKSILVICIRWYLNASRVQGFFLHNTIRIGPYWHSVPNVLK